jgi:transcriptional regulator with XRE-family HTH domain
MIRIDTAAHIGPALADLRLMHGLTQRQICAETGIWQGRVSAYERGSEIPGIKSLLTILGAMDLGLAIVPLGEAQVSVDPRWERLIEVIAGQIRTAVRGEIENGPTGAPASMVSDQGPETHTRVGVDHSNGATGLSGGVAICGHCGEPQRGYASLWGIPLCHPNEGLDCYRLVTVYGHGAPCLTQPCYDPHPTESDQVPRGGWTRPETEEA